MKIELIQIEKPFAQINAGDVFYFRNSFYIKVSSEYELEANAVMVLNGQLCNLGENDLVILKHNARMVVDEVV